MHHQYVNYKGPLGFTQEISLPLKKNPGFYKTPVGALKSYWK